MISVIKCWCMSLIDQESSFGKGVKNRRHDEWCLYLLFKWLKKELHFNLSLMCSLWLDEFQGNEMHKLHWVIPELTYFTPLSGSRFYKLFNSFFSQADGSWAPRCPPNHPVGHLGMSINLDLLCTLVHLHTVLKLHYHYVREMKQIYFTAAVNNLQFPAHIQSSSYVLYTRPCIVVQE